MVVALGTGHSESEPAITNTGLSINNELAAFAVLYS